MFDWLSYGLGFVIKFIYDLVKNYGLAIILFTIVIKLALMPLNVRSQKSMRKTQKIQPYLAELQEKYKNDQQKLQQEMMKVYRENNIKMTGGCLPLLIQFPILISLYQVIQRPLQYMLGISWGDGVWQEICRLGNFGFDDSGFNAALNAWNQSQIMISKWAEHAGTAGSFLNGVAGASQHPWVLDFNFLGLDLSVIPSHAFQSVMAGGAWTAIIIFIIPILAVVSSIGSMKISQIQSGQNTANTQANQSAKMMSVLMPAMTGFFTIILPAGLGLYWIISSVIQIIQQIAINYYLEKKGDDTNVIIPEKKQLHGKKRKK